MSESQHDRDLERYLQRGDPLSRAYDPLREEMPPEALDRLVLERARAELARKRHLPRWPAYAAIAATIVLSFATVLRVDTGRGLAGNAAKPAILPDTRARDAAPATPPFEIPPGTAPAPAQAPASAAPLTVYEGPAMDTLEKGYVPQASAESQADLRSVEGVSSRLKERPHRGFMNQEANSPVTAVGGGTSAKARASAEPAVLAAPPPSALPGRKSEYLEEKRRIEADREMTVGAVQSAESAADDTLAPEAWLKTIEEMRATGRRDEAEREMKRFLEKYPGYFEKSVVQPTK